MDQTAWVALFAGRGTAAMDAERERIARKLIERDGSRETKVVAQCVVLESACGACEGETFSAVQCVERAGAAAGWRTRTVRSLAVDPRKGLIEAVTVRLARHDERMFAAWWNGHFNCAQYWSSHSRLESLGATRMSLAPVVSVPVDAMTVSQVKVLAVERGIGIPSKFKKAEIIEHVKAAGLVASMPPPPIRGVLDAIEGIQLTCQGV